MAGFASVLQDRAVAAMIAHAAFPAARTVFEFGCGTGRLAARLLNTELSPGARYTGVDISAIMMRIARERLRRWRDRAVVRISDGSMRSSLPDRGADRFVSTYVLDLLSGEEIAALLAEARRVLADDGLLCLVCLTDGERGVPRLVGGCRPIRLRDYLVPDRWETVYRAVVVAFGVSSEVVIAQPITGRR